MAPNSFRLADEFWRLITAIRGRLCAVPNFWLSALPEWRHTTFMRTLVITALIAGTCIAATAAETRMIPVTDRNGADYISAAELERSAGIAIKKLPGSDAVVACSEDRCARVKGFLRDGDVTLVNVAELAKALGFAARFSDGGRQVHLEAGPKSSPAEGSITRVGDLAPNFRIARLDGSPVSLADFHGKRLLIQSWASWWGCRNDLPVWQDFYQKHRSSDFEILSIAVDVQGASVVKPYVEKAGVKFAVGVDTADVLGQAFGLKAIPVSIFVDEVGIVRLRGDGPSKELLAQIEELLRERVTTLRGTAPQLATAVSTDELERKVAASADDWKLRLALARAYADAGRSDEAVTHLEVAAKIQPGESSVSFVWGLVVFQQGQKDAALPKLKQACDLDPDNWRIRKQIWAIENPDKFYSGKSPDYGWQSEQLKKEKN
jgi:tetratricopeptide (TPR) repeat protein